jgi:DNA (cytosine-5)-methyltransferase 1
MNVLDLFSGIGGFSIGLERAGMRTVAFCEANAYARAVLAKHWPGVPCYPDVRELSAAQLRADGISVDVICGGFPCQDISTAGSGAGLDGERSGLWFEYARLIGEIRPRYIVVENVAALLSRGLERVLGSLASLGYDAEWHCIPASAVGAPHRRDRIWIVAYADPCLHAHGLDRGGDRGTASGGEGTDPREGEAQHGERFWIEPGPGCEILADPECWGLQGGHVKRPRTPAIVPPAFGRYCGGGEFGAPWRSEPDVGRVAHGIPFAMDRLERLGNAVLPQIPEIIGRAIMRAAQ